MSPMHAVGQRTKTPGPPEQGADPRAELADRERLRHVVVGAQVQPDDAVRLLAAGGQHQDRDFDPVGPQLPADVVPARPRQHQIENQEVRALLPDQAQAGLAVPGGQHLVGLEPEAVRQRAQQGRLVFDDEDPAHVASPPGSEIVKVLPSPGRLSTAISPPWALTI
jgi:hypothetical protein